MFKLSGNLKQIYIKQLSTQQKPETLRKDTHKDLGLQKQPFTDVSKKILLKKFAVFTKNLYHYRRVFVIKLHVPTLNIYLKGDPGTDVFL